MEDNIKKLWLSKIKAGKVAVVESHYAPKHTNCVWLKDNTMYVYANSGWVELSSSEEDTPTVDPKYVPTPLELKNVRAETFSGNSFLVADATVSSQNTVVSPGSRILVKDKDNPGQVGSFGPVYKATFAGDNPEADAEITSLLSSIYPDSTINFVSVTADAYNRTSAIVADINGERMVILADMGEVTEEMLNCNYTINYKNTSVDSLITPIPLSEYPITFKPFVIYKEEVPENPYDEEVGEMGTEFSVGWYADNLNGDVFYNLPEGTIGMGSYTPRWNKNDNLKFRGVATINGFLSQVRGLLPFRYVEISDSVQISDILPNVEEFYFEERFGSNNGVNVYMMSSNKYKGKTLAIYPEDSMWTPGTGLTDTQLLTTYFDCTEEELANMKIVVDLYYDDGMH